MMRNLPRCLGIALVLTFAAVGSLPPPMQAQTPPPGQTQPSVVGPANEDTTARAMLLTISDMPVGWSEQAHRSSNSSGLDACFPQASAGETGSASTQDFTPDGGQTTVSESLSIFDNQADALLATAGMRSVLQCAADGVNAGTLDSGGVSFSGATVEALPFRAIADSREAYRLRFTGSASIQSGLSLSIDGYVDVVVVTKGRVGFLLLTSSLNSPFDATTLASLATRANSKITI